MKAALSSLLESLNEEQKEELVATSSEDEDEADTTGTGLAAPLCQRIY